VKAVQKAFVHKLVEEVHLLRRMLQDKTDDIFKHAFCQTHIVIQVSKGHLWFNHPELRSMAGGIGILGAEGGAEGIYVAESHGIGLGIQLSANGQVGGLAEKVLAEIHLSLLRLWDIV